MTDTGVRSTRGAGCLGATPMQRPAIIKGYADTRDGQVHFRRVEGGPGLPLVFLHQTASSGAMSYLGPDDLWTPA